MSRLNYYNFFKSKPPNAEDRLTRAFMVLVRLIPSVQAAFIEVVREKQLAQGDGALVPARTATDTGVTGLWSQTGTLHADEGRVLSILLTNHPWTPQSAVQPSTRKAVYDGVMHYGDEWIFAIENKPYGDVREEQLHPNIEGTSALQVDPRPIVIVWKDLIRRLHAIGESGWLDYTQQRLVDDFLQYARDDFPAIDPYPTLGHCGDDLNKLNRRCESLMKELAPDRLDTHRDAGAYIDTPEIQGAKRIIVTAEEQAPNTEWTVDLKIYPGDTISQARHFYKNVDTEALLQLTESWDIRSNLHFSHVSSNLVYPGKIKDDDGLRSYFAFWKENSDWIRRVNEGQFDVLLDVLTRHGFLQASGHEKFNSKFVETNRSYTYVCPGLSMTYRWSGAEAVKLDQSSDLAPAVDGRIREAVRTWGAEAAWDEITQSEN